MPAAVVAAAFQHVDEALDVGIDIGVRIFKRIAHAGLRREMDDMRETVLAANSAATAGAVGEIELDETEAGMASSCFSRACLSAGS